MNKVVFGLFGPNVKKMRNEGDIEGMIKALKHNDDCVRGKATVALAEMGDPRAIPPLIEGLNDEDKDFRTKAAVTLGFMAMAHDEKVLNPLIQALKDTLQDESTSVRLSAVHILRQARSPRGIDLLTEALEDEDKLVREMAAEALKKINNRW